MSMFTVMAFPPIQLLLSSDLKCVSVTLVLEPSRQLHEP